MGWLLRFREYAFALQAEIRNSKLFFMIGVPEVDRQYLRFLWPNPEGKITVWHLTKLPFGTNCSPFILNVVLRLHLSKEQKEARSSQEQDLIQLLKDSLYVDDCISSLPSKDEAESFPTTSTALLKKAGMDLRK